MRIADPWVRSDRSDHCATTTASSKLIVAHATEKPKNYITWLSQEKNTSLTSQDENLFKYVVDKK